LCCSATILAGLAGGDRAFIKGKPATTFRVTENVFLQIACGEAGQHHADQGAGDRPVHIGDFMKRRVALTASLALMSLGAAALSTAANAADAWPNRTVRLVVPFPAGGSTDVVARLIAQKLSEKLKQQFVVDNRPGAAGNLGTDNVAKSAPDGYTFALTTSGPLANNKFLYKPMPFDTLKDVTPVVLVGDIPMIIAANPGGGDKTLQQFLARARANPGKLTVGHPGTGTIGHLTMAYIAMQAKIQINPIPYKGDSPGITDLVGGTLDALSIPVTALISNVQAGKVTGLAVTSAKRFPGLPNVPTAQEQGLDVVSSVWFAVVGPAGVPAPIVEQLNAEINTIIKSPEAREKLAQFGAVPGGGTPKELKTLMETEGAKWQHIIEEGKITID
jgi:tripartite-type tricarboxylate transporter receptor subunit TctC